MSNENITAELTSEILDNKPEVSEFADDLLADELRQQNAAVDDSNGFSPQPVVESPAAPTSEAFNPDIHQTDLSGQPVFKKDGTYAKKRGRKTGTVLANNQNTTVSTAATAQTIVSCIFILGQMIDPDEWKPTASDQMSMLAGWTEYCASANLTNIPPWLTAAIVTGAYAGPRCMQPRSRVKLFGVWNWFKQKVGSLWKFITPR